MRKSYYLSSVNGFSRMMNARNLKDAILEAKEYRNICGYNCSILDYHTYKVLTKIEMNAGNLEVKII
jgi:hypothetical protein